MTDDKDHAENHANEYGPRLAMLTRHIAEMFGKKAAFVLLIAPEGGGTTLSASNMATNSQVGLMAEVIGSYAEGASSVDMAIDRTGDIKGKTTIKTEMLR